ncbi:hypothetical protein FEM48_Zijuj10G0112000 [Ziziphus jujuba var. spinosa]|uniref:Cytochrome b561 domain-containing protein n=1 Tax=Ziziphus jujuba var. spinosa TaxID=714518 RepID=A0A978UN16_ZIZJJ|nr:hypothetical protein FEM48_Zijuj10G0112000 [Ziziphus jujuba var. spinosa]
MFSSLTDAYTSNDTWACFSCMRREKLYARKRSQKAVHLLFYFIALVVGVLGTYAVFKFHNEIGLYDITLCRLKSLSSFSQWLFSFFTYQFPSAEKSTKARLKPWHKFVGRVIFLLGICTVEIGLAQVGYFLTRSQEALSVNFTICKGIKERIL